MATGRLPWARSSIVQLCSRCRRLRARISSPCIGWTLGERLGVDRAGLTLAPTGTACRLFAPTVRYDWSVTLGAFFDCTAMFVLQTPQGATLVTLHSMYILRALGCCSRRPVAGSHRHSIPPFRSNSKVARFRMARWRLVGYLGRVLRLYSSVRAAYASGRVSRHPASDGHSASDWVL